MPPSAVQYQLLFRQTVNMDLQTERKRENFFFLFNKLPKNKPLKLIYLINRTDYLNCQNP